MKKFLSTIICFAMLFLVIANTATVSSAQDVENSAETSYVSEVINDTSNENSANESLYHCFSSENTVRLMLDSDYYPAETEIDLVIHTSLSAKIENMEFTAEGFSLTNDFQTVGNEIHFSVLHISEYENPHLMINFDLVDAPDMYVQLFGVVREDMLFVNQYGYLFAEQAYEYHFGSNTNTSMTVTAESMENVSVQTDDNSIQTTSSATPDTTIQGRLLLQEGENEPYPVRFCKISFYEDSPIEMNHIGDTYTDVNGYYSFSFANDLDDEDGAGSDICILICTESYDVFVSSSYYIYTEEISHVNEEKLRNMTVGVHNLGNEVINIDDNAFLEAYDVDSSGNVISDHFFDLAMKVLQMAVYSSFYYEEMNGEDAEDIILIFPSIETDSAGYNRLSKTIHISGPRFNNSSYVEACESWDAIMHEYGHHVANLEGWYASPGGGHDGFSDMAEHYKMHYLTNNFEMCDPEAETEEDRKGMECALYGTSSLTRPFTEDECKYQGMALAWSEGFATFFGICAQLYCQDLWFSEDNTGAYTHSISTFGNERVEYGGLDLSLEINLYEGQCDGQNNEIILQCVLFDLYDGGPYESNIDKLSLGHQGMWNLLDESNPKTLLDLTEYFESHYSKEEVSKLGRILQDNYYATSAPSIREQNGNIKFNFSWKNNLNDSGYYNAYKYQINFYDEQYNLITTTEPYATTANYVSISSTPWNSVINNRNSVYISITTYEYDGNVDNSEEDGYYITHYESALAKFINPSVATEIYYNTEANVNVGHGSYAWYKFTAPSTTTYTFSTSGNENAYWELFGFTVPRDLKHGLLDSSNSWDSYTNLENSAITYNLTAGDTVYIRICGVNYGSLSNTTLEIEHVCTYDGLYAKYSATQHKATCFCGNTRYESHIFLTDGIGIRCKGCGYFTTGPGAIVKPFSSESGIDSTDYVCYYIDEDKKY